MKFEGSKDGKHWFPLLAHPGENGGQQIGALHVMGLAYIRTVPEPPALQVQEQQPSYQFGTMEEEKVKTKARMSEGLKAGLVHSFHFSGTRMSIETTMCGADAFTVKTTEDIAKLTCADCLRKLPHIQTDPTKPYYGTLVQEWSPETATELLNASNFDLSDEWCSCVLELNDSSGQLRKAAVISCPDCGGTGKRNLSGKLLEAKRTGGFLIPQPDGSFVDCETAEEAFASVVKLLPEDEQTDMNKQIAEDIQLAAAAVKDYCKAPLPDVLNECPVCKFSHPMHQSWCPHRE